MIATDTILECFEDTKLTKVFFGLLSEENTLKITEIMNKGYLSDRNISRNQKKLNSWCRKDLLIREKKRKHPIRYELGLVNVEEDKQGRYYYGANFEVFYPFIHETAYSSHQVDIIKEALQKRLEDPALMDQLKNVSDFKEGLLTIFTPPQDKISRVNEAIPYTKSERMIEFLKSSNFFIKALKGPQEVREEFIPDPVAFVGERLLTDFYAPTFKFGWGEQESILQSSILLDIENVVLLEYKGYRICSSDLNEKERLRATFQYIEDTENHRVKRYFGDNWARNMLNKVDECYYYSKFEKDIETLRKELKKVNRKMKEYTRKAVYKGNMKKADEQLEREFMIEPALGMIEGEMEKHNKRKELIKEVLKDHIKRANR